MFILPSDPACSAGTLATSRYVNASPHALARVLQDPSLFRPATDRQRLGAVAIHLNPAPQGHGAVTFQCSETGTSERRLLRTRQRSTWRLAAETEAGDQVLGMTRTPAFALNFVLTPLIQRQRSIVTHVGLTFHFVREPWWPSQLADALAGLADLWLQRLEEQARSTA